MYREQDRTDKGDQVADVDAQSVAQTEEVHPDNGKRDPAPNQPAAPAAKKQQIDQRDDQDITGCKKAGLADRGIEQPDLLGKVGCAQCHAAAHAADEQGLAGFALFLGRFRGMAGAVFVQYRDDRQQHDAADQAAREQEGKRADVVHADALCDEGEAPDGGGEQQDEGTADFQKDSSFEILML